ncbi:HlyD family type I secretion periplasmic adaptor subunit [Coralliovum pocilloporae]|uniref:HlyD family type I secretion periplasmic adaptor subunit n=1 Tax=Coralliovum pocilloporae TaxID=3066369 RepID=UPI0033073563
MKHLQAEKSSLKRKDEQLDFLPGYQEIIERPPSRAGRLFACAIMALCAFVVLWAFLGRIDVIASAPGKLIVSEHSKKIQASEQGEITHIAVRDGQRVSEGDVLIALNPVSAQADKLRLREQIVSVDLEIARLRALLSENPIADFVSPAGVSPEKSKEAKAHLEQEYRQAQTRLQTLESRLQENLVRQEATSSMIEGTQKLYDNVSIRYEARQKLHEQGHFAKMSLYEMEKEVLEQKRELSDQKARLQVLEAAADILRIEQIQIRADWRSDLLRRLETSRRRSVDLKQELVKAQEVSRLRTIVSPVAGVVQDSRMHTLGGVVSHGQELMTIVPDDAHLIVDVKVLNKDVGFIRPGQPVEIKIDSFPYTEFGTIKGAVAQLSRDASPDEQLGLVYSAKVTMEKTEVAVNGRYIPLAPGMNATTEIKIGKRRIISYVLSPLKAYQSEALRER